MTQPLAGRFVAHDFFIDFEPHDHYISVTARTVGGWNADYTPILDEWTELLFEGTIKWDGCSHLTFGHEEGNGYLHLCGPGDYRILTEAMCHAWRIAKEEMPGWNAEVAGELPFPRWEE